MVLRGDGCLLRRVKYAVNVETGEAVAIKASVSLSLSTLSLCISLSLSPTCARAILLYLLPWRFLTVPPYQLVTMSLSAGATTKEESPVPDALPSDDALSSDSMTKCLFLSSTVAGAGQGEDPEAEHGGAD
jgi:hypothetical protein